MLLLNFHIFFLILNLNLELSIATIDWTIFKICRKFHDKQIWLVLFISLSVCV